MDEAGLLGRTPEEVREQYGEPFYITDHRKELPDLDEFYWVYQRGWMGASRLTFKKGGVVNVEYRPGK